MYMLVVLITIMSARVFAYAHHIMGSLDHDKINEDGMGGLPRPQHAGWIQLWAQVVTLFTVLVKGALSANIFYVYVDARTHALLSIAS